MINILSKFFLKAIIGCFFYNKNIKNLFTCVDLNTSLYHICIDDAKSIYKLINSNRSYLREWLPWVDNSKCIDDSISFIKRCENGYRNIESIVLTVIFKNRIVGLVSFNKIDHIEKTASIGYWIVKKHQGKGIVKKSCISIINYGFKELNLEKVIINCAVKNYKSQMIPKNLKFKHQEIILNKEWLNDRYVDHIVFSLTKEKWRSDCLYL